MPNETRLKTIKDATKPHVGIPHADETPEELHGVREHLGYDPDAEAETTVIMRAVIDLGERLNALTEEVLKLVNFVDAVQGSLSAAREAPGMQGMMARQMLPDLSQGPSTTGQR